MPDLALTAREIIDRASATQHWTLDPTAKPGDRRTPVTP
jgi:hypothetical protein